MAGALSATERMFAAARALDREGLALALREGADANALDIHGSAALGLLIMRGSDPAAFEPCLELLLGVADPRQASEEGDTPLMIAAQHGREKALARLLPLSDARAINADGVSALMRACEVASPACAALLLPASDPLAQDRFGLSALMKACAFEPTRPGHAKHALDLAKLLAPVSDLDAQSVLGRCALALAAKRGHAGVAMLLLPSTDLNAARPVEPRVPVGEDVALCHNFFLSSHRPEPEHEAFGEALSSMRLAQQLRASLPGGSSRAPKRAL